MKRSTATRARAGFATFPASRPTTMKRTEVADTCAGQMLKVLAAAGVDRIYAIVGDSVDGFTDVARRMTV